MPVFGARRGISLSRPDLRQQGTLVSSVPRGFTFVNGASAPDNYHWGSGVALVGESCGGGFTVEAIDCELTAFSGYIEAEAIVEFNTMMVWTAQVAAVISGIAGDVVDAAARHLEEQIGFALAAELYNGTATGNPAIRKDPTVIAGAATQVDDLLCVLEEGIVAEVGNMQALIHVPAGLLNRLATNSAIKFDGGVWHTPTGHLVIGDGAYSGASPIVNGTPMTAPAAGEGYVYVTGPVAWDYGPETLFEPTDLGSLGARTNQMRGQAQRPALAVYDPLCLHLALLADVC